MGMCREYKPLPGEYVCPLPLDQDDLTAVHFLPLIISAIILLNLWNAPSYIGLPVCLFLLGCMWGVHGTRYLVLNQEENEIRYVKGYCCNFRWMRPVTVGRITQLVSVKEVVKPEKEKDDICCCGRNRNRKGEGAEEDANKKKIEYVFQMVFAGGRRVKLRGGRETLSFLQTWFAENRAEQVVDFCTCSSEDCKNCSRITERVQSIVVDMKLSGDEERSETGKRIERAAQRDRELVVATYKACMKRRAPKGQLEAMLADTADSVLAETIENSDKEEGKPIQSTLSPSLEPNTQESDPTEPLIVAVTTPDV